MSATAAATAPAAAAAPGGKKNISTILLIIGLIGLAIGLVALITGINTHDSRLAISWLVGFAFWFAVLTGMLFLTQILYLFDAGWGVVVRRQLENCLAAFKWLWLLFVPVLVLPLLLGEPGLVWRWMNLNAPVPGVHEMTVGADVLYLHKAGFLNVPFFIIRMGFYAFIMCGLAYLLRKNSFANDINGDPRHFRNCRIISGVGIFLTAFCATFAAFDLFMSLSYHWFSTMYGVWFFSLSMRLGIAGTAVVCFYLSTQGRLKGIYNNNHAYFLGCLALAFTVFWAYISFSQFFLIYNANIPEETFWYNIRQLNVDGTYNGWWWIGLSLIFCYFLVPFIALLWYPTKVIPWRFRAISLWILFFGFVDLLFNIVPIQKPADNILGYKTLPLVTPALLVDLCVIAGIGGVCIWAMLRSAAKHKPIPVNDPRVLESIHASQ